MSFKKRQLVLAALVVSLGAAVYLNWQFSGTPDIIAANTSQSDKELGAAALVNASASTLTSKPASVSSIVSSTSSTESKASVSSASSSTASQVSSQGVSQASNDTMSEYFNQTRLSRQKSRDEAIELLEKVMNDSTSAEDVKKKAVDDAAVIAQNMLQESNIENLIKSKGYVDCVVFLQNGECSVVVKKSTQFVESDTVTIRDIITGQTDVTPANIKIVSAE